MTPDALRSPNSAGRNHGIESQKRRQRVSHASLDACHCAGMRTRRFTRGCAAKRVAGNLILNGVTIVDTCTGKLTPSVAIVIEGVKIQDRS